MTKAIFARLRSRAALAAETLFLTQQLALYQEPNTRWRCDLNATRFTLVWLSDWFDWQPALRIVQPEALKRWRRQGWRPLWASPAKPRRPPIPPELQARLRMPDTEFDIRVLDALPRVDI